MSSLLVSLKRATTPHGIPTPWTAIAACIPERGPKVSIRSIGSFRTLATSWTCSGDFKCSFRLRGFARHTKSCRNAAS
jgi:hypothetical protein